jgi:DNA-binding GntR family transcriptional regulator
MDETLVFERVPIRRLGDIVYESLVQAIASGRLLDGTKLYEDQIAKEMGLSKTPVREALSHLVKDGFVEADLHRTPVVRKLSRREIEDICEIRESLEPLAVRLVTKRGNDEQLRELSSLQEDMEARLASRKAIDITTSVTYNEAFHRALVVASGNERLRMIMEPLWVQIMRLSFVRHRVLGMPETQARAIKEHRAILDAIATRNEPEGEALMRKHLERYHDLLPPETADDPGASRGDA